MDICAGAAAPVLGNGTDSVNIANRSCTVFWSWSGIEIMPLAGKVLFGVSFVLQIVLPLTFLHLAAFAVYQVS
jgi:hypothetical protein